MNLFYCTIWWAKWAVVGLERTTSSLLLSSKANSTKTWKTGKCLLLAPEGCRYGQCPGFSVQYGLLNRHRHRRPREGFVLIIFRVVTLQSSPRLISKKLLQEVLLETFAYVSCGEKAQKNSSIGIFARDKTWRDRNQDCHSEDVKERRDLVIVWHWGIGHSQKK